MFIGDIFDLDVLEAGQRQFETRFGKLRQFERQHLLIPASVKRQPVVGDDQGALLRGGEGEYELGTGATALVPAGHVCEIAPLGDEKLEYLVAAVPT